MAKTRHSNISPTPSKKKAKEKETTQEIENPISPIQHICRTCLEEIQASSLIPLNDSSSNIRNELRACIPEVDCDLIPEAVLCINCCNALHEAYQFKKKCLETEDKIRQQVHKKYFIDLNKLKKSNSVIVPNENGLGLDVVYINETLQNFSWNCKSSSTELDSVSGIEEPSVPETLEKTTECELSVHADDRETSNNDTKTGYSCKDCDFTCDILQPFILHLKHHPFHIYLCPKCDYQTKYIRVLARHLKTVCKGDNIATVQTSPVSEQNGRILCPICGFTTQQEVVYNKHIQNNCDQMEISYDNNLTSSNNSELSPINSSDNSNEPMSPACSSESLSLVNSSDNCNESMSPVNSNDNNNEPVDEDLFLSNLDEEIDRITPFVIHKRKLIVDLSKSKIPESMLQNLVNSKADPHNQVNDETSGSDSEPSDSLNFFCIYCNFSCVGMKAYRLHMSDHGGSRYICPCNFGTWRWQNFIMHVKRTCILYKDLTPSPNTADSEKSARQKYARTTSTDSHIQDSKLTPMEVSTCDISDTQAHTNGL